MWIVNSKGIMSFVRGAAPLRFRRIERSGFSQLDSLDLGHAESFLEPLPVILDFVRRRPAHWVVGIEAADRLVGFYVVHPDRRDRSCWWLGWFAIDRGCQGSGFGRAAMTAIMAGLRRIASCRRVRLLVDPGNGPALRLYRQAGFERVGRWAETGELVMECVQPGMERDRGAVGVVVPALTLILAMCLRLWRRGVPPAARMSGEFHGPPVCAMAFAT